MTNGPIEFLGEEPVQYVAPSELGGVDGLIQPEGDDPSGRGRNGAFTGSPESKGGHALTPAETLSVMRRAAGEVGSLREQMTGVADDERVVDPLTGREVEGNGRGGRDTRVTAAPDGSAGSAAGSLSDLRPE